MQKDDQLCILRAEVKTDADALNLLRLVGALTALGVPLVHCNNDFGHTEGSHYEWPSNN